MTGLESMITQMERWLGTGEPNAIQEWYRARNGADYTGNWPWCDATITRASVDSGNYAEVCHGVDYAYTVAHAAKFAAAGQWHAMTNGIAGSGIRRGDIVFFDWDGSSSIAAIDHVGIVTSVSGSAVLTIEGNSANVCARRARYVHDIAGFGRPAYKAPPASAKPKVSLAKLIKAARTDPGASQGHQTYAAGTRLVESALLELGYLTSQYARDGSFGTTTVTAYAAYQRHLHYSGTAADGIPGTASLTQLGKTTGLFTVTA